MQLVAYGAQDIYLTGNPQITFFKVVYRRHTNFSIECIQQTINGTSTLAGTSSSGTVTVARNGDLLHNVYVRCDQDIANGISGDKLISEVTIEIGGQLIDKHTSEWLQVWAELTTPESKAAGYKYLTGGYSNTLVSAGGTSQQSIMVPLQFWFCRNPGLALPLIALQYHEVKMKFTWGSATATDGTGVGRDNTAATPTCEVWCDYIYLDTDERRRFAQVSHEYLIEQLQIQAEGTAAQKYKLNLNHPVKELIWTNATAQITTQKARLQLNGHDRFSDQDREYFQIRQPLDHHTAVPGFNIKESEGPQLLNVPLVAGAYQLQALSSNDSTAVATALGSDDTACMGQLADTTSNCNVKESGAGLTTLLIRESSPDQTFKVGDVINLRVNDVNGDTTDIWSDQIFQIIGVRTNTGAVSDKTITELSLDRNPLTLAAPVGAATTLADGDDLVVTILARTQNPKSRCSQLARDVNVYSFALKPEEHQPSGTCNFSRIDNAHLIFSSGTPIVNNIYAVNYNVLRIMSGMGGLAYSN